MSAPPTDASPAPDPAPSPDASAGGVLARGVVRTFGAVRAVDGADLVARPGAVTALIGPNGSGKTTLLLVLMGLLRPDAGHVRVAGLDPVSQGPAARTRIGWMPDVFGTWDSLTAREVLTTVAAAYRLPQDRAQARAAELLALLHLSEFADRPAHVLSRGQKQRLGLARALVHEPAVLLLDEPASGLDPRSRVDLRHLLRDLASAGTTVLVSSHVLSELDEMADDAVFLSRGRTVATESVRAISQAGRQWRVRALEPAALLRWLDKRGVPWVADDPTSTPGTPRAVLVTIAGEENAARFLRDAVGDGVAVTSLAPAGGALEQTYLALDEERR